MIAAMDSAVLGMMAHQMRMDVIGNDIANVNTVGYKHSNVSFKETFVQSLRSPMGSLPGMQRGMGVQMGQITRSFESGGMSQTGQSSHLALFGDGFFVVGDQGHLTRAGDFLLDTSDGNAFLITPQGDRLRGVMNDALLPAGVAQLADINLRDGLDPDQTLSSFSVGMDGIVRRSVDGGDYEIIGRVAVATVDNPAGLEALGGNLYRQTDTAFVRDLRNPGEQGTGQVYQGFLENSNVDLAREFTEMIITQRGFQANSRTISTADDMLQEVLMLKR